MIVGGAAATIATGVVSSSLSTLAIAAINHVIYGTFNPSYNKLDRKRMRHIQRKYILAYEGQAVEGQDRSLIISGIDPTSRLLLNPEGTKPLNPFHDEAQFEESLIVNFHAGNVKVHMPSDTLKGSIPSDTNNR